MTARRGCNNGVDGSISSIRPDLANPQHAYLIIGWNEVFGASAAALWFRIQWAGRPYPSNPIG
jgi:hypothetical protein